MKTNDILIYTFPLFALVASCGKEKQPTPTVLTDALEADIITQGNKETAALFGELSAKLKAAMQSGGPEKAITVCKEMAQPTTQNTSDAFANLKLTRISLKPRNPANNADSFDQKILHAWEQKISEGAQLPPAVVKLKNDSAAVYYKPILTGEICLNCHGDPATFPESFQAKLKQLYPNDQATGYKAGNLRGAFRVEFPIKKAK
jgi:hypothetical protein